MALNLSLRCCSSGRSRLLQSGIPAAYPLFSQQRLWLCQWREYSGVLHFFGAICNRYWKLRSVWRAQCWKRILLSRSLPWTEAQSRLSGAGYHLSGIPLLRSQSFWPFIWLRYCPSLFTGPALARWCRKCWCSIKSCPWFEPENCL